MNHCFFTTKTGKRVRKPEAKNWDEQAKCIAMKQCAEQGWTMTTGEKVVMDIMTYWGDRRKRDTHNSIKLLADALEWIVYDNDRYLLPRYIDYEYDRENPRLELVIKKFSEVEGWKYNSKLE